MRFPTKRRAHAVRWLFPGHFSTKLSTGGRQPPAIPRKILNLATNVMFHFKFAAWRLPAQIGGVIDSLNARAARD
ncbi:hypothetical protein FNF07_13045 [Trinickia caryophylli]|nr:hypothetical protein C0Z17_19425 [Trinickia caryophylli]TRX19066.1 hypothetical protein FNF07_13045 [Trinickia caryophylli]